VAGDPGGRQLSSDDSQVGRWLHRGEQTIYDSAWVRLALADVVMPDGTQVDHHVVRMPRQAAGTIIVDQGRVLLLYRHRFITDTWGWEIPAGAVDDGETLEQAAIREAREESGWEPRTVTPVCRFYPANGVMEQAFHIFESDDAADCGPPSDPNEATRIEWFTVQDVHRMLAAGEITDGLSFGGLCYWLALGGETADPTVT
jgi:8-oxo-dGTP pyrophosphatase MutT (NUDIX family)